MTQILFGEKAALSDMLHNIRRRLFDEISKLPESFFIQKDDEAISREFVENYTLSPPRLHIDKMTRNAEETEFSLRELYPSSQYYDESSTVQGQIVRIYVPFEGDHKLFRHRGNSLIHSDYDVEVRQNEIILQYRTWSNFQLDRGRIDKHLADLDKNLDSIRSDIDQFHQEIKKSIPNAVAERRKQVERDREKIEKLGIPARVASVPQAQVGPSAGSTVKEPKTSKKAKSTTENRDVFLAHAGLDKNNYVRPFCAALDIKGISYWLDEAEIKWGDDITAKINEGMRISRYVIVFISESFLGRKWPEKEMSTAMSRENRLGKTILLPLFIEKAEVILNEYPLLEGKSYLEWGKGLQFILDMLIDRLAS
jgi:hypothetical protein